MKKTIILLLLVILLTGCNTTKKNNKVEKNLLDDITIDETGAGYVCTINDKNKDGFKIAGKYVIFVDNNEYVERIESSEIMVIDDFDKLNQFESYYNSNYEKIANYGGFTYDIYQENDHLISNVIIDYTMINVELYITDYPEIAGYFNEEYKINKDSIIDYYESNNIKCEKK